jgi:hypothetical protein
MAKRSQVVAPLGLAVEILFAEGLQVNHLQKDWNEKSGPHATAALAYATMFRDAACSNLIV